MIVLSHATDYWTYEILHSLQFPYIFSVALTAVINEDPVKTMFDTANLHAVCHTFPYFGLNMIVESQVRIQNHTKVFGWLYRGDVPSQQRQIKLMEFWSHLLAPEND